ncbi:Endocuticle structural glycoprotein SgAbd-1 [Dufourea novaeangliae]|uniref:Endocuticle structural glycoprotein SgAbd-1 n=1 Tax=Dufourea novaeangliae TaxID=178035 RepID=A0A154P7Q1_DUFNO|nr:Endocuticle structural glycoprotein SgAbd-1 [Dufourea novaeangliae]
MQTVALSSSANDRYTYTHAVKSRFKTCMDHSSPDPACFLPPCPRSDRAVHCQEYFRQPEKIISDNRDLGDNRGHYSFTYETEGGIVQKESGSRKYAGTPEETQLIQGSVQYNAPDGTPIAISWTADEFGTQVAGSHIPTPPPIPPAIQKALEWIAKQPSTPEPEEPAKDSPSQQNAVRPSSNRQFKSLRANQRN